MMRGILWSTLVLVVVGEFYAFHASGLSLDLSTSAVRIVFMIGIVVLAACSGRLSDDSLRNIVDFLECFGLLSMIGMLGGLACYASVSHDAMLADEWLASADRSLGFDWVAQYLFLAHHPFIAKIAEHVYGTIFYSPPIVLASLVWSGRTARAYAFILAFAMALAATIGIFHFFPAYGALAYHIGLHPTYVPVIGLEQIDIIDRLRSGALTRVNPDAMAGIISVPSFHAASALLFVWAVWPVRWLRLPMLAANLAMLAATPVEGMHYLSDVLAGLAVAACAIAALRLPALIRRGGRDRSPMPAHAAAA